MTEIELDWARDAVWVQKTSFLLIEATVDGDEENPEPQDMLLVRRQNGETFTTSRAKLSSAYEPVLGKPVYRPKFNPARMLRFNDTARVRFAGLDHTEQVSRGTVLLQPASGEIERLDEHEFLCNYRIIAAAGPEPV